MNIFKLKNPLLVGISLSSIGVPLGMYFNYFYPGLKWSPIFMALAFIFTCNWGNLLRNKFPLMNGYFKLIIVAQLLVIFYGVIGSNTDNQILSFLLFTIAYVVALATNCNVKALDKLPQYMFFMSLLPLVLGTFVCLRNLVVGEDAWLLKQELDNYSLEPFSVSQGALTNMIAGLCMAKNKKWEKILFLIALALGTYVILSCEKRTPYIVFCMIVIYYFYVKSKNSFKKIVPYAFVIFVLILLFYLFIPFFHDKIDDFVGNTYNGLLNLLGDTSVSDKTGSAIMRVHSRERAYQYITENFGFMNYIFGGGFLCVGAIDNPILQMYIEMGLLGASLYFYIVVYTPLKIAQKRINNNSVMLTMSLTLYSIISIFNSGHPYMWAKWTPVAVLVAVVMLYKLECKHNRRSILSLPNEK